MSVVTITEAAKLAGRDRKTLYRDIEKGRLTKIELPAGGPGIDTADLKRLYPEPRAALPSAATVQLAALEEKIRGYEDKLALMMRIVELEKKARQLAATGHEAQLAMKDELIAELRQRMLLLERQSAANSSDRYAGRFQVVPGGRMADKS